MSNAEDMSAVDAVMDENLALRDEADDVSEQRDEALRQRDELAGALETERGAQRWGAKAVDTPVDGAELADVLAERDSYLADSQRLAADFANYRKQTDKRVADSAAAQSAGLVRNLLPVLDACDSALEQDPDSSVAPIRSALLAELERSGLVLLAPEAGAAFDPEMHEAVMHEVADADVESDHDGPAIAEVLRAGYLWMGKVVRPAMVKVIG